jgi:DNA invertase Pin-like site-specific DNA recombinase
MEPKCFSYIRFSTPEQIKGDSLRRQIALSEEYAAKNGLVLDDSLSMRDMGLSAYHGHHIAKGALGQFLKLVSENRIAQDSVFLVESLDRLSRQEILEAFTLFLDIIKQGIKIVTLTDNKEFTRESINDNPMDLMMSLAILSRGHEESLIKSKRVRAAWNSKRKNITNKKLTAQCPAWLRLSKDKTTFTIIPERREIINRIFKLKLEGLGSESIAKKLNKEEKVKQQQSLPFWLPKPRRKNSFGGWRDSYINKILRSRAVLGEYQPHTRIDGKRQPAGEPEKNYYPSIVPDDLFYRVQELLARNLYCGGRTGIVGNLFPHITKCGYCGASMHFVNKGYGPKGGQYLVCDQARRGLACKYLSVRYPDFEKTILLYCQDLDVQDIMPDSEQSKSELQTLLNKITAIKARSNDIEENITNLIDSIATTPDQRVREALGSKLSSLYDEQEKAEKERETTQLDIKKITTSSQTIESQIASVKELLTIMDSINGDELKELRLRLKNRIRDLIENISVYRVDLRRSLIQKGLEKKIIEKPDIVEKVKAKLKNGDYDNREACAFTIKFRTGNRRVLTPYQNHVLYSEYDSDTGKTLSIQYLPDGTPTVDVVMDSSIENKNIKKSK